MSVHCAGTRTHFSNHLLLLVVINTIKLDWALVKTDSNQHTWSDPPHWPRQGSSSRCYARFPWHQASPWPCQPRGAEGRQACQTGNGLQSVCLVGRLSWLRVGSRFLQKKMTQQIKIWFSQANSQYCNQHVHCSCIYLIYRHLKWIVTWWKRCKSNEDTHLSVVHLKLQVPLPK